MLVVVVVVVSCGERRESEGKQEGMSLRSNTPRALRLEGWIMETAGRF